MSSTFGSIRDMFVLKGRKAVITGSGGGIGGAIAHGLSEFGVDVALLDLNFESIEKLEKELKKQFKINTLAIPVDVSNSVQVREVVDEVADSFGRIDILVNCHGVAQRSAAEEINEKDWNRMLDVNLKGVLLLCQAVGRYMIKQKYGKIINIASMSGMIVNKNLPQLHYNSSKAAVIMLTKCLTAEWAKYGINVNSISPGYTLTPQLKEALKTRPELSDYWMPLIPMERFANPIDIVGAVIFLSSEASNYINGHNLVVDGGYTVW